TRFSRDWSSDVCSSDLGQRLLDLALVGALSEALLGEAFADAGGGIGAEIRLDEHLFELVEPVLVQRLFGEAPDDLFGHRLGGAEIGRAPCRERAWIRVV